MADLGDYRREIDGLDAQLVPLFEKRMELSRKVAAYKLAHHLPVLHSAREEEVLQKAESALKDPSYAPQVRQFMCNIMELSRAAQHRDISMPADADGEEASEKKPFPNGTAGFYGAPGSFSEQALIELFGENCPRLSCQEFEDVFLALQNGEIVCGVLPIENSSTGSISQVYDLLGNYGFYIVGEHNVKISQNLVALPGTKLEDIRTVYSHPQGIEQSSTFLSAHPAWDTVPFHSTARSAEMVAESGNHSLAAIASVRAADLYGLEVLCGDIQDNNINTTRFIVVARVLHPENAEKISMAFSLDHTSGTLYNVLRHFAQGHINMTKIESRPIPEILWNYRFYLDFEGSLETPETAALLESLKRETKDFRLLGAYRRL